MGVFFLVRSSIAWTHPQTSEAAAGALRYELVSREDVESRLKKYGGSDYTRERTIKELFAEAGCDTRHLSEQAVPGAELPNVICVLPGSSNRALIVGAHFDHVNLGEGIVDNWSGASLLPSLFQAVKGEPRTHSYVFVAFADQPRELVGSRFYVHQMTKEQVALTDVMVNMDSLGLAPTKFWNGQPDRTLSGAIAYIAKQLDVPVEGINTNWVGRTDSVEFSARKIPVITIHSLTQQDVDAHIIHTSKDNLSAINLDDYYQTYSLMAAYLVYLDKILPAAAGPTPK
jgi:Zn-dependent M28 family amino/carboxypeptidase